MDSLPTHLQLYLTQRRCPTIRSLLEHRLSEAALSLYLQLFNESHNRGCVVSFEQLVQLMGNNKSNAKRLLLQIFPIPSPEWTSTPCESTGGRPNDRIMLTYNASHILCLQHRSPQGKLMAGYFLEIIYALRDFDKLQQLLETRNKIEDTLIEHNAKWPLVYLADVFVMIDDELVILKKIGWTSDIASRQLARDMHTACVFTHVFRCVRALALEQDVLKTPEVLQHRYKSPINGHISTETVQFSETWNEADLVTLVKSRLEIYNTRSEEVEMQVQTLALQNIQAQNERDRIHLIQQIATGHKLRPQSSGQQYIIASPPGCPGVFYEHKARKNPQGYRVQRIDPAFPDRPIDWYESANHATCKVPGASKSRILSAIQNHTLYMENRWCRVAHDLDPNVVHDLPPLQHMRKVTKGMVAQLDQQYNIKKIYRTQREAKADMGLKSTGAICNAVKNGTICRGHFYKLWDNCTEAERTAFIEKGGEPETPDNAGIRVSRMDNSGQTFEIYANIETVLKLFNMGRATLRKAIQSQTPAKGWYWAYTDKERGTSDLSTKVTEQDNETEASLLVSETA